MEFLTQVIQQYEYARRDIINLPLFGGRHSQKLVNNLAKLDRGLAEVKRKKHSLEISRKRKRDF